MDTYTPMRAMIVCANGTGDYIKAQKASIKRLTDCNNLLKSELEKYHNGV